METKFELSILGNGRHQLLKKIGSGGMGVVYEAVDLTTNVKVALKTLKIVDSAAIYRFKVEFRSLSQIYHRNLVQLYELFSESNSWYFTMELVENSVDILRYLHNSEDGSLKLPSSISLDKSQINDQSIQATRISSLERTDSSIDAGTISSRLSSQWTPSLQSNITNYDNIYIVFKQLCNGIFAIHRNHRLHRDIKPSNTLITPDGRLVILDFGLVTEIDILSEKTGNISRLEGITDGEIIGTAAYMSPEQAAGKPLTTASDLYSIGVILFQVLTGRLPFAGDQKLVIRDKQRFNAVTPSEIVSGIPEDLNALCQQLLSRNPEDRPTLEETISRLIPGQKPDQLYVQMPPRGPVFVGRSFEINELSEALELVRDGKTVVYHIQGTSGSGKSTLIERFLKKATAEGSIVLSGNCYENESVPYKAIDSLIDSLTKYLLSISLDDVMQLLPEGIESLAKVFPALLRVPQIFQISRSSSTTIDAIQGRHVAFAALREMLKRLSRRDTITLSIDDLQWGDSESSALLANLLQGSEPPSILFIFSYRTDYIGRSAWLKSITLLPSTPSPRVVRKDLLIKNFNSAEVRSLAKALLPNSINDFDNYVEWIIKESEGSALFINELVRFCTTNDFSITNNKLNLDTVIWSRVVQLQPISLKIIKIISVAGHPINLQCIQSIIGGICLPIESLNQLRSERLIKLESFRSDQNTLPFHDRIRETITSNLSSDELINIHFELATSLEINNYTDSEAIADHYLFAKRQQKASHFYFVAANESQKLFAIERTEQLFLKAISLSQDIYEQIKISVSLIHFYTDAARFKDAYEVALKALSILGLKIPSEFNRINFLLDWIMLELRLKNQYVEKLEHNKLANDINVETSIRIINSVLKSAYQIRPELCAWLSVKLVNICLKYGNTKDCSIGYVVFGSIFKGGILGRYSTGYKFGQLALKLIEKFKNDQQRSEVNFVVGYFATSWMKPAVNSEILWKISLESGQLSGDLFHIGCSAVGTIMSMYIRGVNFEFIQLKIKEFLSILSPLNLREPLGILKCVDQSIRNLNGRSLSCDSFSDNDFNEEEFVSGLTTYGSRHFAHFYFIIKMQSLFLWGRVERSLIISSISDTFYSDSKGMLHLTEHYFYQALIIIEASRRSLPISRDQSGKPQRILKKYQKWSKKCPENFKVRELILSAELASLSNKTDLSSKLFTEAIQTAIKYNQIHLQGIAELLLSRDYLRKNKGSESDTHIEISANCFHEWGAFELGKYLKLRLESDAPISINYSKS